jgi:uncharacterized protein (TIGR00251 family)
VSVLPTRYPAWLSPRSDGVLLDVLVSPRASRNRIMGVHDNRLKIQLAAPPVEGKANDALVRFLALALGVPRAKVEIVGGPANKRKTVRITGVPPHLVLVKLSPMAAE